MHYSINSVRQSVVYLCAFVWQKQLKIHTNLHSDFALQHHHCSVQHSLGIYTGGNLMGKDNPQIKVDAHGKKKNSAQDAIMSQISGEGRSVTDSTTGGL